MVSGMKRILLIDDAEHIVEAVAYALESHGFIPLAARDASTGMRVFESEMPNLVLLDLNLPDRSGLEVFHEIRSHSPNIPVIMLTARVEEADRVLGLEMGADDYVTKPFSVRELIARIKVVLRRTSPPDPEGALEYGPLRIDPNGFSLLYHGEAVKPTRAEFDLLRTLAKYPARVFSRDSLIRSIYEDEHPVTDRTIDACVKRIRKKLLAVAPETDPIETIYGVGYKLNQELQSVDE